MNFRTISIAILACLIVTPVYAATCESLKSLSLENTTVTMAETVAAGQFSLPPSGRGAAQQNAAFKKLPAFCRVAATLKPSSDSDIKVEVWLPMSNWNRKYQAVGNGGWAGVISYSAMAEALERGYATSSTDTGHVGGSGSFALGHQQKLVDFGYRSEHEMTVKSKQIIDAFYGSAPQLSYWNGCSTGGRQGLKEAQMFPNDYDGIIAGAPANRTAMSLWIAHAVLKNEASYIPAIKYPMIHKAVIEACDALDGVNEGLLEDPRQCKFDPKVLQCKGEDNASCLTAPQVKAAQQIYSPGKNSRTGQELFPSLVPGTELGWGVQAAGPDPSSNIWEHYKYVVYKDPKWDWRTFDFDKGIDLAERPENNVMNSTDPNLKQFFAHNGKLLIYHGWADTNVATLNTIKYYNSVLQTMGGPEKTMGNVRLFLEPGMGHCRGGEGPDTFDKVGTLEQWVEKGKAPEQILASHSTNGKVDRTRPLCPYPKVAQYKGSGSIDEAASFVCK